MVGKFINGGEIISKYIDNLLVQFNSAKGIKNPSYESEEYISEFSEYLHDIKKAATEYKLFLKGYGLDVDIENIYELGKGQYDSLSTINKSSRMNVISKYGETLGLDNSKIIIQNNKDIYIQTDKNDIITPYDNGIYITQNPYLNCSNLSSIITQISELGLNYPSNLSNILDLIRVYNLGKYIYFGYYFFEDDKDAKNKEFAFRALSDILLDEDNRILENEKINGIKLGFVTNKKKKLINKIIY